MSTFSGHFKYARAYMRIGRYAPVLHHMKDHRPCPIGWCITGQAKWFLKVIMNQQRRILQLLLTLHRTALSHASVHFHGLSFCKRSCRGCQDCGQIGKNLTKIWLQFCNIGPTVGLHDCLHFLWQGSKAMLVNPVSKKLKPWVKENALGRIQSDPMIL